MTWFYNLKLRAKLMTGFVLVAIVAGVIGTVGVTKLHEIDAADIKLYEKITVPLNELSDISTAFQRVRINLRDVIDPDIPAQERKVAAETAKKLRLEISEKSEKFEKTILSEEGRKVFEEFKKKYSLFVQGRILSIFWV